MKTRVDGRHPSPPEDTGIRRRPGCRLPGPSRRESKRRLHPEDPSLPPNALGPPLFSLPTLTSVERVARDRFTCAPDGERPTADPCILDRAGGR